MKTILTTLSITVCFVLSTILSSCSVIKRHYMNGYYISHNSGKQTDVKTQDQISNKEEANPSLNTVQNLPERDHSAVHMKDEILTENSSVKNVATKKATRAMPHKRYISYIVTSEDENAGLAQLKKTSMDSVAGDALSLFWIIILLLLILWLVAILSGGWGLGGFVHIILIVALVLLILWLFRII
jgi:Flp pilus assembly protein TadB